MDSLKSLILLITVVTFSINAHAQYCVDLPVMNGTPQSYTCPNGWNIWHSTPDIITGNGVYPGTTQANITDVNGSSSVGGEMVFFLINGILGQNTEGLTTVLSGLVPGTDYFVSVEWQQVTLDYIGVVHDPKGGKLGMYLDGNSIGTFSSSGGLDDDWQTATVSFVATGTSHTLGLKGELLDNSSRGAIVIDDLPCSIILPVELVDFTANKIDSNVQLEWKTLSETNCDYFAIERSNNAVDWETIAVVEGADNSSALIEYTYLDKKPLMETSYYRLRQVDFNGKYEHSDILSVNFEMQQQNEMSLYPNPTSGIVRVFGKGINDLSIMDFSGRMIELDSRIISSSKTSVTLDLSSLASGVYLIVSPTETQRLIIN